MEYGARGARFRTSEATANGGAAHDKLFELEMPAETQFSTLKLNPKPYKRYKPYKPDKPFKPKNSYLLNPKLNTKP